VFSWLSKVRGVSAHSRERRCSRFPQTRRGSAFRICDTLSTCANRTVCRPEFH